MAQSLPPTTQELQQYFVALFARSIDEVSKAQMLAVQRDSYLAIVRLRKKSAAHTPKYPWTKREWSVGRSMACPTNSWPALSISRKPRT